MKKLVYLFGIGLLLALGLNSCGDIINGNCIEGNGDIITETRTISGFDGVNIEGSAHVIVTIGKEYKVAVESDANIINRVETYRAGTVLVIDTDGEVNICPSRVIVYITAPDINRVDIEGSGDVDFTNDLTNNEMNIGIEGSGDIRFKNLITNSFEVEISGSGDLKAAGSAKSCRLLISGSGNIDLSGMEAASAEARISGSGNIRLWVKDFLRAIIDGSGNIYYSGTPALETAINGSGKIIKI